MQAGSECPDGSSASALLMFPESPAVAQMAFGAPDWRESYPHQDYPLDSLVCTSPYRLIPEWYFVVVSEAVACVRLCANLPFFASFT